MKGRRLNPNLIETKTTAKTKTKTTAKTKTKTTAKTKAKTTAKTKAKTDGLASRMDSDCWLGGLTADHP